MNALELLEYEINQVGKQIDACLNGMSESCMDTKCSPAGMTPREILGHLCDAYEAHVVTMRGEKYEFGSFQIEDKSTANLRRIFADQRAKAVKVALSNSEDETLHEGYDYIVGHDNYHVGQLCLSRVQDDPNWDYYSIYS
jgi:hypothetical protein